MCGNRTVAEIKDHLGTTIEDVHKYGSKIGIGFDPRNDRENYPKNNPTNNTAHDPTNNRYDDEVEEKRKKYFSDLLNQSKLEVICVCVPFHK